ncbi:MAG TPA: L-glutamate gamma-semialdehyde dehydrogenase [Verrucomicrobiae bacterium]|nr:L-glutamate gamma-semialdehyde dehydrogenase [Verrucomicrobiae bacterium]
MNPWQSEIESWGREILARMQGETPRIFERRGLAGRLLDWSMRDDALKVQLFRLVDVLPTLASSRDVARHVREHLADGNGASPALLRWAARLSPAAPWATAAAARRGVAQMARMFILAPDPASALPGLRAMRERRITSTIDLLGETAVSEAEADRYQARYAELLDTLAGEARGWRHIPQIDRDDRDELPKVNVSVKLSALCPQIRPTDPEGTMDRLAVRLRPLLRQAAGVGAAITFDMESTALKDLTLGLFKRLLDEAEFRDYPHAGIAVQAYLRDSESDLRDLIAWAHSRGRRIAVRLVKGAYWDHETTLARQRGWPVPVFERKSETDANYERLARLVLENRAHVAPAFATHNVRTIAACIVAAEKVGADPSSYEFQMLYGMAEPIKTALIGMDRRLRDYCPIGEMLPGMSYLVRRLLENTSNEGFLRAAFGTHVPARELLHDPAEAPPPPGPSAPAAKESAFHNEPLTDFNRAENRRAMAKALEAVRGELGREYPIQVGGTAMRTNETIVSINPARPSEVIGRVARAGIAEADAAIAAARAAFPRWRHTPIAERARVLERAAELLRHERFRFASLEVFEAGKNWTEADADVAEAIDFCNFYAEEMRRLGGSRHEVPGEESIHHHVPRGVAVVIAPWNFPLAILCGMSAAALVAGNCVILKPSEQTSVTAAWFMDVLRRAGAPPGTVGFLPGPGSLIGEHLVRHPDVDIIAFTGSREVGLRIWEAAAHTAPGQANLKKVVCEMGGKNAIIVDADADLDEAIPGILHSAFGYQGQKCSALSRLILLDSIHDRALGRLVEAARSLAVGPAELPGTVVGPLIDRAAFERVRGWIARGKQEARLAFEGNVPTGDGYFVPPVIFADVPPSAGIAREEIFGPVLCILRARDLSEAIALANATEYALTGGIYSRSPGHIARATAELQVGNLYINRPITGALVGRHPFGGFKMSGGGTQAGGPEYLTHFLFPRTVSENLVRRGFAPDRSPTPPSQS